MQIQRIRVRNFRCLRDAVLECKPLTILIGPNGSGKSSFLRALDLFYIPIQVVREEVRQAAQAGGANLASREPPGAGKPGG